MYGNICQPGPVMAGNAVQQACRDLKEKIKAFAAPMLGVKPNNWRWLTDKVSVKGNSEKTLTMAEIGGPSVGGCLTGIGVYAPAGPKAVDPERAHSRIWPRGLVSVSLRWKWIRKRGW